MNYVLNNEAGTWATLSCKKKITTQTLPFKSRKNHGEQTMYYIEDSNPAIVSRETYEAVQALIKKPTAKL